MMHQEYQEPHIQANDHSPEKDRSIIVDKIKKGFVENKTPYDTIQQLNNGAFAVLNKGRII